MDILTSLNFPKNMRWADHDFRFVRPIRGLVALFGEEVVPVEITGVKSGKFSRGHRFLRPSAVEAGKEHESVLDAAKAFFDTAANKVKNTADHVASDVSDAVDDATSDSDSDGVKQESADDFMTKDFAELLASEPFTESADVEDVADMLKDLI